MSLLLVILVIVLLFGGGGFYSYGRSPYLGGGVGIIGIILILWLVNLRPAGDVVTSSTREQAKAAQQRAAQEQQAAEAEADRTRSGEAGGAFKLSFRR